jgi:hypothetical protein
MYAFGVSRIGGENISLDDPNFVEWDVSYRYTDEKTGKIVKQRLPIKVKQISHTQNDSAPKNIRMQILTSTHHKGRRLQMKLIEKYSGK